MNTIKMITALLCTMFLLTACNSSDEQSGSLTDGSNAETVDISGLDNATVAYPDAEALSAVQIQGVDGEGNATGGVFDDPRSPLSKQTIYFEYDSSQVKQEFMSVIYAHAGYLAAHADQIVVLQGHADERGSREYNIALGEQRSKSVARIMQMHGVANRQLQIVSYGEEKPALFGHSQSSWQQNRRVEIMYLGKK